MHVCFVRTPAVKKNCESARTKTVVSNTDMFAVNQDAIWEGRPRYELESTSPARRQHRNNKGGHLKSTQYTSY